MSGARRLARVVGITLGAVLLRGGTQSSVADDGYDELARFPGLGIPVPAGGTGAWVTPQQTGVTYLKRAMQWTRTPTLQSVAFNRDTQKFIDPTCKRIAQAPGSTEFQEFWADVVLVDRGTALDSRRRYGYTQAFVVRTVAFGSVPVEATVALEQPRNAKGVVIPTTLKQARILYCEGQGDFEIPPPPTKLQEYRSAPAEGSGRLRARIDRLVVDGVAVPMTNCVADKAALTLTSRDYLAWDPRIPDEDRPDNALERRLRTPYFSILTGGLLFGSLDIPAFSGCVTRDGEDLSALLTASVSGDGNTVQLRTEGTQRDDGDSDVEDELNVCPFVRNCTDRWPTPELPTVPPS